MAKYTFKSDLSVSGIKKLQNELSNYANNTLTRKTNLFLEELGNHGITFARNYAEGDSHKFSEMIVFEKKVDNMTLKLIGRNDDLSRLITEWYDADGNYHDETISPILAIEWGTAAFAKDGHKGTFAITGNHVNSQGWEFYVSEDKSVSHKATAEEPKEPMHNAFDDMVNEIGIVARKVFQNQ